MARYSLSLNIFTPIHTTDFCKTTTVQRLEVDINATISSKKIVWKYFHVKHVRSKKNALTWNQWYGSSPPLTYVFLAKIGKGKSGISKNWWKTGLQAWQKPTTPSIQLEETFSREFGCFSVKSGPKTKWVRFKSWQEKTCCFTQHPLKNWLLPKKKCLFRIHFWPKSLPPPKKKAGRRQQFDLTYAAASKSRLPLSVHLQVYTDTYILWGKVDWSLL